MIIGSEILHGFLCVRRIKEVNCHERLFIQSLIRLWRQYRDAIQEVSH